MQVKTVRLFTYAVRGGEACLEVAEKEKEKHGSSSLGLDIVVNAI